MLTLVTGGARSGKSRHAEALIAHAPQVLYIATSQVFDDEMAARIQHHRDGRPAHWRTAERWRQLDELITPDIAPEEAILLECITTLVTNLLFALGATARRTAGLCGDGAGDRRRNRGTDCRLPALPGPRGAGDQRGRDGDCAGKPSGPSFPRYRRARQPAPGGGGRRGVAGGVGHRRKNQIGQARRTGRYSSCWFCHEPANKTRTSMQSLTSLLGAIPAPDESAMARARLHIDGLLKPPGSLGRLEDLAVQLAGMPGLEGVPQVKKKALLVMCADHGVWDEGVAISPKAVTAIQAANMTLGKTGVCVLAAQAGAKMHVIDVGIDAELIPGVINMRVARGCGNIAVGPAMRRSQAEELLLEVMRYTRGLAEDGVTLFGVGELGMANTTPAAAIVSVLTGSDAQEVVGIGANLPLAKVGNKVEVVRRAIAVNRPDPHDGLDVLAKVGGFDLLGMTGVMLGAASCGLPVVLDGFLSYAAALAACRMAPQVKPYLIPSHYSAEKGARIALAHLELEPYLNMGMRLGEGSGAALAMPIVEAACAMYHEMGMLAASNIVLPKG